MEWTLVDGLAKTIMASLPVSKIDLDKYSKDFIIYNADKQIFNPGKAFVAYVKKRIDYENIKTQRVTPAISASEGFHVASEDFYDKYCANGYGQFNPKIPSTWKNPNGSMLRGYEAYKPALNAIEKKKSTSIPPHILKILEKFKK